MQVETGIGTEELVCCFNQYAHESLPLMSLGRADQHVTPPGLSSLFPSPWLSCPSQRTSLHWTSWEYILFLSVTGDRTGDRAGTGPGRRPDRRPDRDRAGDRTMTGAVTLPATGPGPGRAGDRIGDRAVTPT